MLLDLANLVADKLFVIPSSSYPVLGDCPVQPTVHLTDRKALQHISCVGCQINCHMTRKTRSIRGPLIAFERERFFLLTSPFILGHSGVVNLCSMPISFKYSSTSADTRLRPLSVLRVLGTPYLENCLSRHLIIISEVVDLITSTSTHRLK